MTKKDFLIGEAIKYGWNIMKANLWFFVGVLIVAWLVTGIPQAIANRLQDNYSGLAALFRILHLIVDVIISIGLIKIALKFLVNEKPEFAELFRFQGNFWRYVGSSILNGLIVAAGIILFIVPGIYWAIKFQFFGYCIVDQKLGPVEALKKSSKITYQVKWKLLGFGLVMVGINILGFLCLFVGLFATIPTTMIAFAYVYRKLLSQTETVQVTDTP
ncbi:MAG: hypothetical protein E3J47_03125 [Candidatus Stahlbacteria bacterium]|nr:MAG: hypothetical protein E3J47_03125 [Candidatus Stahlbacteria bacterium]